MALRWYPIDLEDGGRVMLPSVTTILDATMGLEDRRRLVQRQAENPLKYQQNLEAARARGNAIDRYAKAKLTGVASPVPAQYAPLIRHLNRWLAGPLSETHIVWTDQLVYSTEHWYAGTLDAVCRLPGVDCNVLVDFKTSAYKVFPQAVESALQQCAAYRLAWNKGHHCLRAGAIASVHITPYGYEQHLKVGDAIASYERAFLKRASQFASRVCASEGGQ